MKKNSTHEFALYLPTLSRDLVQRPSRDELVVTDVDLIHRITRVLRLKEGEQFILFDCTQHVQVVLRSVLSKQQLRVQITFLETNKMFSPHISFFLPLLKREALEEAIYSLVEVGINAIQLIVTDNVQRSWSDKDLERAERVAIAAAEQSKNFSFPQIAKPVSFEQCLLLLQKHAGPKIYCDPEGLPLIEVVHKVQSAHPEMLLLMIGPEADLTEAEKKQLKQVEMLFCALTPTILRARQAALLSAGIFRSL